MLSIVSMQCWFCHFRYHKMWYHFLPNFEFNLRKIIAVKIFKLCILIEPSNTTLSYLMHSLKRMRNSTSNWAEIYAWNQEKLTRTGLRVQMVHSSVLSHISSSWIYWIKLVKYKMFKINIFTVHYTMYHIFLSLLTHPRKW